MRTSYNRRTATKVKNGRVQKKNRRIPTGTLGCVIDRESPGRGFQHVLSKRDLQTFIEIVPEWERLSERLERIVLTSGGDCDGEYEFYHREETGAIFLHPWEEDLWLTWPLPYFNAHRTIFERFGVSFDEARESVWVRFTEAQARAFMLLHIFMHELGHHHDRINQKHHGASRGEAYAERFATNQFEQLYPAYVRVFGNPATSA